MGCTSADGTYVKYGPEINTPKLIHGLRRTAATQPLPIFEKFEMRTCVPQCDRMNPHAVLYMRRNALFPFPFPNHRYIGFQHQCCYLWITRKAVDK